MSEAKTTKGTTEPKRRNRQPAPIQAPKLALSIVEAGAALGVSRPTIYVMIQRGQLRTVLIGRRRLIPVSELERILSGAA
jgi:excisionase family DNA binding protein